MGDISRWMPEPDAVTHQALGKLAEEAAELSKACIRAMIQGVDGVDPATGVSNRKAIADEISDTKAASHLVRDMLRIVVDDARVERKFSGYLRWIALIVGGGK